MAKLLRVLCHSIGQLSIGHFIHVIEILIANDDRAAKIDILPGKSVDCVFEHRHRVRLNRHNDFHFRQRRMFVQFSRPPGNVCRLIGDAFDVGRKFHRCDHAAQVRRNGLKSEQNVHAVFIDLLFKLIDLLVICDCGYTEIVVALQ